MFRITRIHLFAILFAGLLVGSCTSNTPSTLDDTGLDTLANGADVDSAAVTAGLPSPIQMALMLMNAEAPYNDELANPYTKAENYSGKFKQALNMGVYQADLGYIIAHHQTQEAIHYLESIKQLGDKLGIIGAFEAGVMDRAEKNLGSKDSLFAISSDAFGDAQQYLDENQRPDVADLIVVGGWVESTYLATQTLRTKDNAMLRRRIGQDKLVLPQLVALVEAHRSDKDYMALAGKLRELEKLYANVKIKTERTTPETDKDRKVTRIGTKTKVRYTKNDLMAITDKVAAIRNEFIQ